MNWNKFRYLKKMNSFRRKRNSNKLIVRSNSSKKFILLTEFKQKKEIEILRVIFFF